MIFDFVATFMVILLIVDEDRVMNIYCKIMLTNEKDEFSLSSLIHFQSSVFASYDPSYSHDALKPCYALLTCSVFSYNQ